MQAQGEQHRIAAAVGPAAEQVHMRPARFPPGASPWCLAGFHQGDEVRHQPIFRAGRWPLPLRR